MNCQRKNSAFLKVSSFQHLVILYIDSLKFMPLDNNGPLCVDYI